MRSDVEEAILILENVKHALDVEAKVLERLKFRLGKIREFEGEGDACEGERVP
jgi:hypothetical protein